MPFLRAKAVGGDIKQRRHASFLGRASAMGERSVRSLISAVIVHLAPKGTVVIAADSFLVRQDFLINKDFLAKKNKTC